MQKYLAELETYVPNVYKRKCVLVPCAADKPYPAPMHTAVRKNIPENYDIIIATGVLGLVPESRWDTMPLYDSGMPYEWRLMKTVNWFFSKYVTYYDTVVVYSDFYSAAINIGFSMSAFPRKNVYFVFPPGYYAEYQDLLSEENLGKLKELSHGR